MVRLKCKKCGAVFEQGSGGAILAPHVGPLHYLKCPSCGKSSWINIYRSVEDPVTYPPQKKEPEQAKPLSEEEQERLRIEQSKYETT
jgi:rubredoxin